MRHAPWHHVELPGPSLTSPSRMRIVTLPFSTRKKSSVLSCVCQVNSPFSLATIRSWPLNWPTTGGCQGSLKVASFAARSMPVRGVAFVVEMRSFRLRPRSELGFSVTQPRLSLSNSLS